MKKFPITIKSIKEVAAVAGLLWFMVDDHYEQKALKDGMAQMQQVQIQQERAIRELALSCHESTIKLDHVQQLVQTHFRKPVPN